MSGLVGPGIETSGMGAPMTKPSVSASWGSSIRKYTVKVLVGILIGALALVASAVATVFAVIALPCLLIAYLCMKAKHLYHNQGTKNSKGIPLHKETSGVLPTYRLGTTVFQPKDIKRLEQEQKRLTSVKNLFNLGGKIRCAAKCLLPVIGPIWAIITETQRGGASPSVSASLRCDGCRGGVFHQHSGLTASEAISRHIEIIKEMDQAKIEKIREGFLVYEVNNRRRLQQYERAVANMNPMDEAHHLKSELIKDQ